MPNAVADELTELHLLASRAHMRGSWLQLGQDLLIEVVQQANQAWFDAHERRRPRPVVSAPPQPADFAAVAEAAFGEGDFARALRYASLAAEGYGESRDQRRKAQVLTLHGNIARLDGDLLTAENSFSEALSGFELLNDRTSTARTFSALAEVSVAKNDYPAARRRYEEAIGRRPTDPDALTGLGFVLWRMGQPADAEAAFGQALTWRRTTARALAGRGQVRIELRMFDQALDDLNDAITLGLPQSDEIDARSARAVALARLGRTEEAATEIEAALRDDPERELTLRRAREISSIDRGAGNSP
jgi:tetratricopeptide (TPR) repeat protein